MARKTYPYSYTNKSNGSEYDTAPEDSLYNSTDMYIEHICDMPPQGATAYGLMRALLIGCKKQIIRNDDYKEETGMNNDIMFDYLVGKQEELNSIDISILEKMSREMKEIFYNLDIKAADQRVFWKSIDLDNGWSIQMNTITNNCRILDDNRFRRCYGPRRLILGTLVNRINENNVHGE